MFSQYGQGQRPLAGRVPLPHEDQAHFYGAPQLDFGPTAGQPALAKMTPGERGCFFGFDTLDGIDDPSSSGLDNVVVCGYEGGLEIYSVQHDGAQLIGVLEGLKGKVVAAKILPWSGREDPFAQYRPLVAVTVHGPVFTEPTNGDVSPSNEQAIADSPQVHPHMTRSEELASRVGAFQTSVQVFSLARQVVLSTLYTAPAVPLTAPMDAEDFEPPAPSPITVHACSKFVVVAIGGRSGEVYVFSPTADAGTVGEPIFRCLGKLWTSVAERTSSASSSVSTTVHEIPEIQTSPVFSLSDRWLALVPPQTSTQFSLYGTISENAAGASAPGLTVSMSPNPPPLNCAVDTPDDRFVSRMSRIAAKSLAKGAQWASDYGMQLWKQYTGQQPTQAAPDGRTLQRERDPQQHFPPTHAANDMPRVQEEAKTIAVYDLEHLIEANDKKAKHLLGPVAVFEQALGCSFLSFAPSGLHLLSVSEKGDTQVLWDLKRMCHGRGLASGPRGSSILGPHVREITRITRVTDANVVDIIWSAPSDEKMALLTDKGTLHVHVIDPLLLQWPPQRRLPRAKAQDHSQAAGQQASKQTSPEPPSPSARSRLNSAYDAVNGATSWLTSMRGRSVSNGTGLPSLSSLSLTPAAGAKTAKTVAASAGKAIGQGVHDFRHAADNKIYLRAAQPVGERCAMWMTGDGRGLISVLAHGSVKMFRVRSVAEPARAKGGQRTRRVILKPMHEVHLQGLPNHAIAPALLEAIASPYGQTTGPDDVDTATGKQGPQGMWRPRLPTTTSIRPEHKSTERTMWKSYAELQTTAPYAKFHTDPRVSLFVYTDANSSQPSGSLLDFRTDGAQDQQPQQRQLVDLREDTSLGSDAQWVFGDDIPVQRISTGAATAAKNAGVIPGGDEADGFVWRNARDGDGAGEDGIDGFFEDDADVIDFAEDRV